jgi:hypothetical protein
MIEYKISVFDAHVWFVPQGTSQERTSKILCLRLGKSFYLLVSRDEPCL